MRSVRMFEIIQLLRSAKGPYTAQNIAGMLEVTKRTIYRDIASLQSMQVPIDGAAGIGYIMRPGYNLPSLNFDIEEVEAISVALSMISRTGDKNLEKAGLRVMQKLSQAAKLSESLFSSSWGANIPGHIDLSEIREAIRQEVKIGLIYRDAAQKTTERTLQPVALIYYTEAVVIAAWCEMRNDFRHFRSDRIITYKMLKEHFKGEGVKLRTRWIETQGDSF